MTFEDATQASEALRNQGYFVEHPFRISHIDNSDPDNPVISFPKGENAWFFNVYTNDELQGDWIEAAPISSPYRICF